MSGEPRLVLDLTKHAWSRRYGDIMAWGTWFYDHAETRQWRPCLALTPVQESRLAGSGRPYIVPVSTAFLWSEDGLGDPAHAARSSFEAAWTLGLDCYSPLQCMRIASIVRDNLGILLTIPPRPTEDRVVVADAFCRDEAGSVTHVEVADIV